MSLLPITKPVAETPLVSPVANQSPASSHNARQLLDDECTSLHSGEAGEHVTDPALAAYLEWVDAANTVNRDYRTWEGMADDTPERDAVNEAVIEAENRRDALEKTIMEAFATGPVGVLAKLAFFTWSTSSCMYKADVRFWQGMIGDLARLGILPLETDYVAPFGKGRHFGALHRAAMSKEGIDPSGRSIALPSSLWEPTIEQAGIIYRLPVGVAELMVAEEHRIRVTNAEKAAANPDGAKALDERLLTAFRRVPDERKAMMLRWLEFGVTTSHLHAASLRFAQENDLLDEYRDRLISQLREVADAQFRADLNDLPAPVRSAWAGLIKAAARGEGLDEAVEAFRRVEREEGMAPGSTDKAVAFAMDMHRRRIGYGDADLLAAFDEWVRLERKDAATDDDAPALLAASSQFAQHQPQTLAGVSAALRFLFAVRGENPEHYDTVLNGNEPTERALSDYRDRLLWNTIQAVERMQAGGRASEREARQAEVAS